LIDFILTLNTMEHHLHVFNTLTRKQERFIPLHPPYVGMYLCGPTVYGHAHLGHARSAINFDVIYRYLTYLGYQVRYVRNITDVGHLEREADDGKDKIAQQAQIEQLEPMEVVQRYANSYHQDMARLNVIPPSIEPHASGHIQEQISMIQQLLANGFAYEVNGSVYFDINAYNQKHHYGQLSGREVADMLAGSRSLLGQEYKKMPLDFALWKKADSNHLMHWPSPWGEGFPGWHIECTTMATKYLGDFFDIHGGGLDLLFPHHECELAQSQAAQETPLAKYWLHNNLITINGKKMGKSLNNFITLGQLFAGTHPDIKQAYSPMALRFFILQAHYRSTLAFSPMALQAAEQGYLKLMNGLKIVKEWHCTDDIMVDDQTKNAMLAPMAQQMELKHAIAACQQAMDEDFNTAKLIAALFHLLKIIHEVQRDKLNDSQLPICDLLALKKTYATFLVDILGLKMPEGPSAQPLLSLLLDIYRQAKHQQHYSQVDAIRETLKKAGIGLQDMPHDVGWYYL